MHSISGLIDYQQQKEIISHHGGQKHLFKTLTIDINDDAETLNSG